MVTKATRSTFTSMKRTIPVGTATELNGHPYIAGLMPAIEAAEEAGIPVPSGRRVLVATFAWFISFASSYYWGIQAIAWMIAVAATATTSQFLLFLVAFIGGVIAIFTAFTLAGSAFNAVLSFDVHSALAVGHDVRDAAKRRVSLVRGWFKRSDDEYVHEVRAAA